MRKTLAVGAIVATALFLPAAPAAAEERTCRGQIGAVTLDNVRVPQGATCTLNGTRVQGTVKVERGATLQANGVRVNGNVQGEGAARVTVAARSQVGGSVQVVQGARASVTDSRITGSIQYEAQRGPVVAQRNIVNADVQVFQNRGGATIRANRIDGNLQCKANTPAPVGGANVVQGNKEDQCARL